MEWTTHVVKRSANLREPAQVDSIHADKQHPGAGSIPPVRHNRHPAAARYHYDPMHRRRHGHHACRIVRLWRSRLRHNDTQTARSSTRSSRLFQVRSSSSLLLLVDVFSNAFVTYCLLSTANSNLWNCYSCLHSCVISSGFKKVKWPWRLHYSRSSEITLFNGTCITSYWWSVVTFSLSCIVSEMQERCKMQVYITEIKCRLLSEAALYFGM